MNFLYCCAWLLTSKVGDSSSGATIADIVTNENEFLVRLGQLLRLLLPDLIVVYYKHLITVIRLKVGYLRFNHKLGLRLLLMLEYSEV